MQAEKISDSEFETILEDGRLSERLGPVRRRRPDDRRRVVDGDGGPHGATEHYPRADRPCWVSDLTAALVPFASEKPIHAEVRV